MNDIARAGIDDWMRRYLTAWETDAEDDVAGLFTEDAEYRRAPYDEPIVGRAAIVAWWIAEDEPADHRFEWTTVATDGDTAVVTGRTRYEGVTTYENLWVIRFGEPGRAASFTEWWMQQDG